MNETVYSTFAKSLAEREGIKTDPEAVMSDYKAKLLGLYAKVGNYFGASYSSDYVIETGPMNVLQMSRADENGSAMSAIMKPKADLLPSEPSDFLRHASQGSFAIKKPDHTVSKNNTQSSRKILHIANDTTQTKKKMTHDLNFDAFDAVHRDGTKFGPDMP